MDRVSQHPIEYQSRREALSRNAGAHPDEYVSILIALELRRQIYCRDMRDAV
jgi:hypothetical protein